MLINFIKTIVANVSSKGANRKNEKKSESLGIDSAAMLADRHDAIRRMREYLKQDPGNIGVLNNLGGRLSEIGSHEEAIQCFETAYALDDTFLPAIVNHASVLIEKCRLSEALPLLERAKLTAPKYSHIDTNYAQLAFCLGDIEIAIQYKLDAWLSNFDHLRNANGYLWFKAYGKSEQDVAIEHRFWAETMKSQEDGIAPWVIERGGISERTNNRKIKIGYWSPDLVNHSVRYFAKPLIANHDRSKFEVTVYHDIGQADTHTEYIRNSVDHFHDVFNTSDVELVRLIRSHKLDILVELAGHSSYNRVHLLKNKLAKIQVSALGYPPTTGLETIDAKIIDKYIAYKSDQLYYAEYPLVLSHSFWCFDPMEETTISSEPPYEKNGYITFGCATNVSKINERMIENWKSILTQLPTSRLIIRSSTFKDNASLVATRNRLIEQGIPSHQLQMAKPEGGRSFFESYNEIDVVLDTFPFNGGTTTCFATYMGVPVVSLYGESLQSRMGLSVLSNLGLSKLCADNDADYIRIAVEVALDVSFLRTYKKNARELFSSSALGNGKLYARDFEKGLEELIRISESEGTKYVTKIPLMSEKEILRRIYKVMSSGNTDATTRLIRYCLKNYPESGGAHILLAQQLAQSEGPQVAVEYLTNRLGKFRAEDRLGAEFQIVRLYLLQDKSEEATSLIKDIVKSKNLSDFDRNQVELYRLALSKNIECGNGVIRQYKQKKVIFLIPYTDERLVESLTRSIRMSGRLPREWEVVIQSCKSKQRKSRYEELLTSGKYDYAIFIHENIEFHCERTWYRAAELLETADVVSFSGSSEWTRPNWRAQRYSSLASGYMVTSSENIDYVEVQSSVGTAKTRENREIVVLDGQLLIVNIDKVKHVQFSDELSGAASIMEDEWTHQLFLAGCKLAAAPSLAVFVDHTNVLNTHDYPNGITTLAEKYKFKIFVNNEIDDILNTVPVTSKKKGATILQNL